MTHPLIRLADRIINELEKIEFCLQRLFKAWESFRQSRNELFLDSVALNFQGAYNGLEVIFELVTRELDDVRPSGDNWHQQLLTQMASEVEGKRPAVISLESCNALNEMRSFRHIVRHVYPFELDDERIENVVLFIEPTFTKLRLELMAFAAFLQAAAG